MNNQTKIARLIDTISFFIILLFIISLLFFIYLKNIWFCLAIGTFFSAILTFCLIATMRKKRKLKAEAEEENNRSKQIVEILKKSQPSSVLEFFKKLFCKNYNLNIKKNYILLTSKTNKNENFVIFYNFYKTVICLDDIMSFYTVLKSTNLKICIFANEFAPDCNFINFNITNLYLYDHKNIYDLIKQNFTESEIKQSLKNFNDLQNKTEPTNLIKKTKLIKEDSMLKKFFDKSNTKIYLKLSFILYILSLFLKFSLYYRISATVFLIFSILCFFRKKYINKPSSQTASTKKMPL